MFKFLCFVLFTLNFLSAAEYQITMLNVDPTLQYDGLSAINDKGQMVGNYQSDGHQATYIYDPKFGITRIDTKGKSFHATRINNDGQVLGNGNVGGVEWGLLIWSKPTGWTELALRANDTTDMNDLGQVVFNSESYINGHYELRPFLWDDGVLTDLGLGSEFANAIAAQGFYHIHQIWVTGINNKGEIVGSFTYCKWNAMKNKLVPFGTKAFFVDGEPHVIEGIEWDAVSAMYPRINNKGFVLLGSHDDDETYLWHLDQGFTVLHHFIGSDFNDANVVIGEDTHIKYNKDCDGCRVNRYSIWRDGVYTSIAVLLELDSLNNISDKFSDNYAVHRLSPHLRINNKGQILCIAEIWKDYYPCILEPVQSKNVHKANDEL